MTYNQIFITLQDVYKTTFTSSWGTFVWVVMLFRCCNVPATFQRLVIYIFINLLFKSMTGASQHLECVREVLMICRKMQLALNPDKTFLGVLLGYVVSENEKYSSET